MPKLARWILAATLMACCAPLAAMAQSRVALVLGNSAYERGPIRNSLADAGLVAEALNGVGFEIMEAADLDQGDLRRAFSDFIARMQAAGPDAIRSEEHTSELQSRGHLVCRLLLEKKKK